MKDNIWNTLINEIFGDERDNYTFEWFEGPNSDTDRSFDLIAINKDDSGDGQHYLFKEDGAGSYKYIGGQQINGDIKGAIEQLKGHGYKPINWNNPS